MVTVTDAPPRQQVAIDFKVQTPPTVLSSQVTELLRIYLGSAATSTASAMHRRTIPSSSRLCPPDVRIFHTMMRQALDGDYAMNLVCKKVKVVTLMKSYDVVG